jgi:hypothetical protein
MTDPPEGSRPIPGTGDGLGRNAEGQVRFVLKPDRRQATVPMHPKERRRASDTADKSPDRRTPFVPAILRPIPGLDDRQAGGSSRNARLPRNLRQLSQSWAWPAAAVLALAVGLRVGYLVNCRHSQVASVGHVTSSAVAYSSSASSSSPTDEPESTVDGSRAGISIHTSPGDSNRPWRAPLPIKRVRTVRPTYTSQTPRSHARSYGSGAVKLAPSTPARLGWLWGRNDKPRGSAAVKPGPSAPAAVGRLPGRNDKYRESSAVKLIPSTPATFGRPSQNAASTGDQQPSS